MKGKGAKKERSSSKITDVIVESGATVTVGCDVLVNSGEDERPFVAHVTEISKKIKETAQLGITWYYFPDDVPRGRQPYHAKMEIFKSNHKDSISSKSVIWTCAVLSLEDWISHTRSMADSEHVAIGPVEGGDLGEHTPGGKKLKEVERHAERNRQKHNDFDEDVAPGGKRKAFSDSGVANKAARKGGENCGPSNGSKKGSGDSEDEEEEEPELVYMCRHEYDAVKFEWKDVDVPVFCLCDLPYNPDLDMIQCRNCAEWYHQDCLQIRDEDLELLCCPETGESKFVCPPCKESGDLEMANNNEGEELHPTSD